MAPRVYGQAVCSGFAKLYDERDQFSDVTLLVSTVEARVMIKPVWSPAGV